MTRLLQYLALLAGLAVVCWIGAGHLGNPLALGVTVLIGAFYLVGAVELLRFQRATDTLPRALAQLTVTPPSLAAWVDQLDGSLQHAVRLRVEGERALLPGPALAPYLAGLLVLLGMVGTFLGMVVTLNGTGTALQGAGDLQSIRDALSAPVRGLGLAFGTSVAGVAASAALGLASALCRRQRALASQALDARIAGVLRPFSLAHQREASLRLQEQQAQAMPALLDRLQAMVAAMAQQQQALTERLAEGQERFHAGTEAAYVRLAQSVDQSLQRSLSESARVAGATIAPMAEATMAGIAREAATLHENVARSVAQQLEALSRDFATAATQATDGWHGAIAEQRLANRTQAEDLRGTLDAFGATFTERADTLVGHVAQRLDQSVTGMTDHWQGALAQQQEGIARLEAGTRQALDDSAAAFDRQSATLLDNLAQAQHALQGMLAAGDTQRLSAWTGALEGVAGSLQQAWHDTGVQHAREQQALRDALAQSVRDMTAHSAAHTTRTVEEVGELLQAAAQAPRAAAQALAELREKLSDSMARDNAMLEERTRLMETLGTLLDAVNHASTEQRATVDAMLAGSADLLERVGERFTQQVDTQAARLTDVAAEVTGSAVEVASMGEAFGHAVQLFSQANDSLVVHLQRLEGALDKSTTRSDEQLAYYVAQAREVIDLSLMSQKQIVDDLQRMAANQASADAGAAA